MKKIVVLIIITLLIGTTSVFIIKKNNIKKSQNDSSVQKRKDDDEKCQSITGGSFSLIFDVENGTTIDNINVCIACSPESYDDIPTPTKEKYVFEGWYYDKELSRKVEANNTKDIQPIPKKENDCIIGYEDITLYAKFEEEAQDTEMSTNTQNNNYEINNNQEENQQESTTHATVKTYQEKFYKPMGILRLYKDGGSFGPSKKKIPTTRPYYVVMGSPYINAMSNGEVVAVYNNSSNYGGMIVTIQTLNIKGKVEQYLIIYNHVMHSFVHATETFNGNQRIAISASNYQDPGNRYSIYTFLINDEIKNNLLYECPQVGIDRNPLYSCLDTKLYSIDNLRIDPTSLIDSQS